MTPKICVVGTTSWGTTLATVEARKGLDVYLWARTPEVARELQQRRENHAILPGIAFPDKLKVTHNMDEALDGASAVIFAVPSQSMRRNCEAALPYLNRSTLVVSAAKGLELSTHMRMSQVISQVLYLLPADICVLSGPNLATEIARGLPAASVVAAQHIWLAEASQQLLSAPHFYIATTDDVVGVELGGSLKNIIALGAGIADGLQLGDNAKAILITEGWAEITRLGVAMGASAGTFSGLAGLGDLIATCASPLSRNHFYGEHLARGRTLDEIAASTPHVAEGVPTTRAAHELGLELNVEMPIIHLMYALLYEGLTPQQAVAELMAIAARIAGRVA